jgi:hypothetical protein
MQEAIVIKWLSLKSTIEYLGEWEILYNQDFNCTEFGTIKNAAGSNNFVLSVKQWIGRSGAIGLTAKAGRYGGPWPTGKSGIGCDCHLRNWRRHPDPDDGGDQIRNGIGCDCRQHHVYLLYLPGILCTKGFENKVVCSFNIEKSHPEYRVAFLMN